LSLTQFKYILQEYINFPHICGTNMTPEHIITSGNVVSMLCQVFMSQPMIHCSH